MTSRLVWSTTVGYPADYNYREYYRDIGFDLEPSYLAPFQYAPGIRSHTGIKYHRITGPGADKQPYHPDWARESAEKHAGDFVRRCRAQAVQAGIGMPFPPVLVSPYDAELFGHWWFEGPQWIYYVFRELARGGELTASTPGDYLAAHPNQQWAMPAASSWGRNGYSEHWVNPKTEWIWPGLHEAAVRMCQAVQNHPQRPQGSLTERLLRQAGRELLLAQASDWPFIITNGTTEEYACRRFRDHLNRFHDLLNGLDRQQIREDRLMALEEMDAIFPDLNVNLFAPV